MFSIFLNKVGQRWGVTKKMDIRDRNRVIFLPKEKPYILLIKKCKIFVILDIVI